MLNRKLAAALAAALIHAPLAHAQNADWTVVAGEDGRVITAGLPNGTGRNITDSILGDVGRNQVGFRISSPDNLAGYWAYQQGTFVRMTELGVSTSRGPGRSGAEAAHVFLNVYTGNGAAAPDAQRAFSGRAGEAGNTATATYGVWRWDGTRNVEAARTLTDGPLGPGLGTGWEFPNDSAFATARALDGGGILMDVSLKSPTGGSSRGIVKHVAGQGNQPCLRIGATEAALAPGLVAGDSFQTPYSFENNLAVTAAGRVYGAFNASGSRAGIWEICNGAPRVIVANGQTGTQGPAIGIATATFTTSIEAPYPGLAGQFYFFSAFRRTSGANSEYGLFWNDGTNSRPMAFADASGTYGPNWLNATWRNFDTSSLSTSGGYAAFSASVNTEDSTPTGFWRVRAGQRPQLLALIGLTGQYGPEPNRTWRSFGASAVMANGDLLLEARTDPGDTYALWLLEVGRAPRKILAPGQAISIATTTGTVQTTVTDFDIANGGSTHSRGRDLWAGADGTVLVSALVPSYGEVLLTAKTSDRIFRHDFE